MNTGIDKILEVARQLKGGREPPAITTRDFLGWFGAQRRGYWVVQNIRQALDEVGLRTNPDFESSYIDAPITFAPNIVSQDTSAAASDSAIPNFSTDGTNDAGSHISANSYADPTFRISRLGAANKAPLSVSPEATVQHAVTLMLAHDYSQLPVMTSPYLVKGTISWSSIGSRLAVGTIKTFVKEIMDAHQEIRADWSLFQAIPVIVQHQYVLVRGSNNQITGIVTATDLSLQFQQLAEPFLLLGEIENHIRRLLGNNFSPDELRAVRDSLDGGREISGVADLTFGDYVRLLENDDRWQKIRLPIDRQVFCSLLDKVRETRNDVMHFDPDGILQEDLDGLRYFANFLQRLQTIGLPQEMSGQVELTKPE